MFKNIHFLNYRLLALELSEGKIDDYLAVRYLIWGAIIFGASINLPIKIDFEKYYSNVELLFSIFSYIIIAVINIFGILYLYQINKSGDDKDFLKRIICLSFPVAMYLMLLYLIPIIIVIFTANILVFILMKYFLNIIISLAFYWIMYKCFTFIKTGNSH